MITYNGNSPMEISKQSTANQPDAHWHCYRYAVFLIPTVSSWKKMCNHNKQKMTHKTDVRAPFEMIHTKITLAFLKETPYKYVIIINKQYNDMHAKS